MQQIHHKRNELLEVEFFKDKECTEAFDFTNAKYLYIALVNGDVTPFFYLNEVLESFQGNIKLFISGTLPKIQNIRGFIGLDLLSKYRERNIQKYVLDNSFYGGFYNIHNITLSKYIPEGNAVLFLSEEDRKLYDCYPIGTSRVYNEKFELPIESRGCGDPECNCEYPYTKITILLPHGTQSELQKANEVVKALMEKYGVKEVNIVALHWFLPKKLFIKTLRPSKVDRMYDNEIYGYEMQKICKHINKIITTNSTGILKPEDSTKHLQVIDCKKMFEEYLNN